VQIERFALFFFIHIAQKSAQNGLMPA